MGAGGMDAEKTAPVTHGRQSRIEHGEHATIGARANEPPKTLQKRGGSRAAPDSPGTDAHRVPR